MSRLASPRHRDEDRELRARYYRRLEQPPGADVKSSTPSRQVLAAGLVQGVGSVAVDIVPGDDLEAGLDIGRHLAPSSEVTAASTPYCPINAGCCATRA